MADRQPILSAVTLPLDASRRATWSDRAFGCRSSPGGLLAVRPLSP
jgi:hypothetical protein